MWASEQLDPTLRPNLDTALEAGPVDSTVFEAYLAAVEMLQTCLRQGLPQSRERESLQDPKISRSQVYRIARPERRPARPGPIFGPRET